jgi:ferredoxin
MKVKIDYDLCMSDWSCNKLCHDYLLSMKIK